MSLLKKLHHHLLYQPFGGQQNNNLIRDMLPMLPMEETLTILDIGSGTGAVAHQLQQQKPHWNISGIDVLVREECAIPCRPYDGTTIPLEDNTVDVAMLINVLHHCDDPANVLREAARVARLGVIVKDHYANNSFDFWNLKLMEWIGNGLTGINQPYHFLAKKEWDTLFAQLRLIPIDRKERMRIYNRFLDIFFGRNLHFLAWLKQERS